MIWRRLKVKGRLYTAAQPYLFQRILLVALCATSAACSADTTQDTPPWALNDPDKDQPTTPPTRCEAADVEVYPLQDKLPAASTALQAIATTEQRIYVMANDADNSFTLSSFKAPMGALTSIVSGDEQVLLAAAGPSVTLYQRDTQTMRHWLNVEDPASLSEPYAAGTGELGQLYEPPAQATPLRWLRPGVAATHSDQRYALLDSAGSTSVSAVGREHTSPLWLSASTQRRVMVWSEQLAQDELVIRVWEPGAEPTQGPINAVTLSPMLRPRWPVVVQDHLFWVDQRGAHRQSLSTGERTQLVAAYCAGLDADDSGVLVACASDQDAARADTLYQLSAQGEARVVYQTRGVIVAPRRSQGRHAWLEYPNQDALCQSFEPGAIYYDDPDTAQPPQQISQIGAGCYCCNSIWAPLALSFEWPLLVWNYAIDAADPTQMTPGPSRETSWAYAQLNARCP